MTCSNILGCRYVNLNAGMKPMASRPSFNFSIDGGSVPMEAIRCSKTLLNTVEQVARPTKAPNRRKETSIPAAIPMSSTCCTLAVIGMVRMVKSVPTPMAVMTWRPYSRALDEEFRHNAHKPTPNVINSPFTMTPHRYRRTFSTAITPSMLNPTMQALAGRTDTADPKGVSSMTAWKKSGAYSMIL